MQYKSCFLRISDIKSYIKSNYNILKVRVFMWQILDKTFVFLIVLSAFGYIAYKLVNISKKKSCGSCKKKGCSN